MDGHGGRAIVEADTPEAQHAEQATRELAAWYGMYLDALHVCANQVLLRRAGLLQAGRRTHRPAAGTSSG